MRNLVSYPRVSAPGGARRIVPALGALLISVLAGGLFFPESPIDPAPDPAEAAPSAIGLRGSYLSDIGPHAPGAFAPRSAHMRPHNLFIASNLFIAQAEAATPEPAAKSVERTAFAPLPPMRPAELRTALAEPTAPVYVDAPLPPRRPAEVSVALKPEPPKEQPRHETAAAAPTPAEPVPSAPPPRQVARATTVVPAGPADNRGFLERLFGGAPQAAAPQAANRREAMAYASTNDAGGLFGGLRSAVAPANPAARYDRYTAIYDISARTVYMPDGSRLEAHSGLREHLDDPRYVHLRMRGPTPPHIYELTPREALFHGVEALRLNPVGGGGSRIYHRAGLLAHTYMLGPNGDSNGCVSFRDYHAFLNAYKRGEIRRLAVVAHM
ncbi:DUF2778 domain-containing protein [Methylocystis parvus]|nr:DUF2778 domain-containing protein [Methylocystis parvus]WBJ99737.1 DUF2778 domain-containing protein [Methylocystis parvus OBBP]